MEESTNLEELVFVLRTQKHDVLNHLQVIQGFLQLNKKELAQQYLTQAIGEIQEKNSQLKLQSPSLVGLLSIYREKFDHQGIKFQIELADNMWEKSLWDVKASVILRKIFGYLANQPYSPEAKILLQLIKSAEEKSCQLVIYNLNPTNISWNQILTHVQKQGELPVEMEEFEEKGLIMFRIS